MFEDAVLWFIEKTGLEEPLIRLARWGEKMLGKVAVKEAEMMTIRATFEHDWSDIDNPGFEDGIPWGEFPDLNPPLTAEDDHRDLYLSDPDNHLDR